MRARGCVGGREQGGGDEAVYSEKPEEVVGVEEQQEPEVDSDVEVEEDVEEDEDVEQAMSVCLGTE